MRQIRIFVGEKALGEGPLSLDGQAARHVLRVLRMKTGEALVLFDGRGGEYPAVITACARHSVELSVSQKLDVSRESPLLTRLAVAVPRGERMDVLIQKATELGVNRVLPLRTERTVVRLAGSRATRRGAHWKSVAASACEQCGRNSLPRIEAVQNFPELPGILGEPRPGELRLMPEPAAGTSLPPQAGRVCEATLLVGPEGGFTREEIEIARGAGFHMVGLGPRILRTETAAIALLSAAQWAWGDLRSTNG